MIALAAQREQQGVVLMALGTEFAEVIRGGERGRQHGHRRVRGARGGRRGISDTIQARFGVGIGGGVTLSVRLGMGRRACITCWSSSPTSAGVSRILITSSLAWGRAVGCIGLSPMMGQWMHHTWRDGYTTGARVACGGPIAPGLGRAHIQSHGTATGTQECGGTHVGAEEAMSHDDQIAAVEERLAAAEPGSEAWIDAWDALQQLLQERPQDGPQ